MRSANMQVLTEDIQGRHPGTTIYGIGDEGHKGSASGHNEDDTPGSRPEQEDPDSKPEHRAIDVMIGPKFSKADAWALVVALVTIAANQQRLIYVIFNRKIWRKKNGWKEEVYTGSDPHDNHVHASGDWPDDENRAHWALSSGGATTTGGVPVSNFMIQVNGDPTIYLSDGFKYRGIASWEAFLTFRDTFKWPYVVVPNVNELRYRAGVTQEAASTVQAILSDEQVAKIEAAAKAGALNGAGGLDLDALRAILDDESISEKEIAERFGAKA